MTKYNINDKILTMPEDDYHAETKNGTYLSSHMLADFRTCPDFYQRKLAGQVAEKPSTAYALGSAAHKLILEGNIAFDNAYLVSSGPKNPKTGLPFGRQTKAYAEWLEGQLKPIISPTEMEWLEKLRTAVRLNDRASDLLSQGQPEGVIRATYEGIPCQIRMDWFNPEYGIVDLKTASNLDWFDADIRRYGYIFQMAFYRAVLREATGYTVPVSIVAVEKDEPFRAGVWTLAPDVLDEAERINTAAIKRLLRCRETGNWPTGFEQPRIVSSL